MSTHLDKLWSLSGIERYSFPESENMYFDPVGLILFKEIKNMGYWCTPENTVTFAMTGGDGVHFGFLCGPEGSQDESPIVMTMPCADTSNIIIAENFLEFLSLGCRRGYFDLERIEYRPEEHLAVLDAQEYPSEIEENEMALLKKIESAFSLKPWSNHKDRLAELKLKYLGSLEYSQEYHEITT
jgi:hypothetical protein